MTQRTQGWAKTRLGDLADRIADGSHNPPKKKTTGLPMLSAKNVHDGEIDFNGRLISETDFRKEDKRTVVRAGDVLLTIVGTIGRSSVVPDGAPPFTLQRSVAVIKAPDLEPKFLMYQLQGPEFQTQLRKAARGTAQKGVYLKTLSGLEVLVPDRETQSALVRRLDELFSNLDDGVASLERAKANLARYRASVLKAAVEGKLLGDCGGYVSITLGDLIGDIQQGWSPKCDKNRVPEPGEWGVIKTTAVQHMAYLEGEAKPLPADLEPRPGIEIHEGDFLMTRKGPRKRGGVSCLVKSTLPHLMVCDTVYRFRADETKVIPEYLEIALNAPSVLAAIDRLKAGISESGLSLTHKKIRGVELSVPPIDTQNRVAQEVARCLSVIEKCETTIEEQMRRAPSLGSSVLREAFRGGLLMKPGSQP